MVTALVVVVQAGDFSMHMMTPSICLRNECKKIAFLNQNNTTVSVELKGGVWSESCLSFCKQFRVDSIASLWLSVGTDECGDHVSKVQE